MEVVLLLFANSWTTLLFISLIKLPLVDSFIFIQYFSTICLRVVFSSLNPLTSSLQSPLHFSIILSLSLSKISWWKDLISLLVNLCSKIFWFILIAFSFLFSTHSLVHRSFFFILLCFAFTRVRQQSLGFRFLELSKFSRFFVIPVLSFRISRFFFQEFSLCQRYRCLCFRPYVFLFLVWLLVLLLYIYWFLVFGFILLLLEPLQTHLFFFLWHEFTVFSHARCAVNEVHVLPFHRNMVLPIVLLYISSFPTYALQSLTTFFALVLIIHIKYLQHQLKIRNGKSFVVFFVIVNQIFQLSTLIVTLVNKRTSRSKNFINEEEFCS